MVVVFLHLRGGVRFVRDEKAEYSMAARVVETSSRTFLAVHLQPSHMLLHFFSAAKVFSAFAAFFTMPLCIMDVFLMELSVK